MLMHAGSWICRILDLPSPARIKRAADEAALFSSLARRGALNSSAEAMRYSQPWSSQRNVVSSRRPGAAWLSAAARAARVNVSNETVARAVATRHGGVVVFQLPFLVSMTAMPPSERTRSSGAGSSSTSAPTYASGASAFFRKYIPFYASGGSTAMYI